MRKRRITDTANGGTSNKMRKIMYIGDEKNNEMNENNLIQQLIGDGFSADEARLALKLSCGNDENECDGLDISTCKKCQQLLHTLSMNTYAKISKDNNFETIELHNNFNHYLFIHPTDDDIDYMHSRLNQCDITHCKCIQRYYKQRPTSRTESKQSQEESNILDKIHCYFYHCYDIGIRLNAKEKNELNTNNENNENNMNKKIINVRKLLWRKREHLNLLINVKENAMQNKENKEKK
eukprot:79797_1